MTAFSGFGPLHGWPYGFTPNTALLDAAGDRVGGVFMAHKAGTIDRIAVYCSTVAGSVPSYDVRLESVTNGLPSGTLVATNTNGALTPTAATLHLVTLTASRTVAKGDLLATSISAASATGANNATVNSRIDVVPVPGNNATQNLFFPRAMQDLSVGTWAVAAQLPCVVPVYSDGSYLPLSIAGTWSMANSDFNSGSTPDERGIRWTQVGGAQCFGASVFLRWLTASADFSLQLYAVSDGDSATPIASKSMDYATFNRGATEQSNFPIYFATPVSLTDGADYRLALVPTTTNSIRLATWTYQNADQRAAMSHSYLTTRTRTADGNAGAWTDSTALMTAGLAPLFDQSTAASGGGGPLIGGRLVR